MDGKLKGLLDSIRKPDRFRGELGETLRLAPPTGSLGAKKLLIIGLGDSQTFSPQGMHWRARFSTTKPAATVREGIEKAVATAAEKILNSVLMPLIEGDHCE
jgi:hypothetical protein